MIQLKFRKGSNGVPILSSKEIEDTAEVIIQDYQPKLFNEPGVLDIEHFIENYSGLELDYQNLTHDQSILGMMVFGDGLVPIYDSHQKKAKRIFVHEGTVMVDNNLLADNQNRRCRFTLAHEVSHWFLHQQVYYVDNNQISLFQNQEKDSRFFTRCRTVDIESTGKRELVTDDYWMEFQANRLAAALLMPKRTFSDIVYKKFESTGIEHGFYQMGTDHEKDLFVEVTAYELADLFDVSRQSSKIRLNTLGLIKDGSESMQFSMDLNS